MCIRDSRFAGQREQFEIGYLMLAYETNAIGRSRENNMSKALPI